MDDLNLNDEFDEGKKPDAPHTGVPAPTAQQDEQGDPYAKERRRSRNLAVAFGAVVLAVVCFFAGWLGRYFSIDERMRTLMWLMDTVNKNYYEEITDGQWDQIYGELYNTVLPDEFCAYYSPEEYQSLLLESQGSNSDSGFSAIDYDGDGDGVNDCVRVYRVVGNSPADLAGIESGMTIYRFGTSEENLVPGDRAALYSLSGTVDRTIWLECGFSQDGKKIYGIVCGDYLASYCTYRDSGTSYEFRGENGLVLTETNRPLEGLDDDTAYISLTQFDGNAAWEFERLLDTMKNKRGRTNLIIDLRKNGGGYLTTFQSIAAHLLRNAEGSNPLVATAKYRSGSTVYSAYGNDFYSYFGADSRITILADENTASASECLIGALVDYGTVGFGDIYLRKTEGTPAHTYGKGVMQSAFTAANGSMVRVTVAQINWPNGRNIHGSGVTETDGANGIVAPLLSDGTDTFLEQVLERIR